MIYRLEKKGAVRRAKKIGNAHIFEPFVSCQSTLSTLIEDFTGLLGGPPEPLVTYLVETGRISSAEPQRMEKR